MWVEERETTATVDSITTFASAPAGATAPDSVTWANGDIWIAYTNGASSTGAFGDSNVVEYAPNGSILRNLTLAGSRSDLRRRQSVERDARRRVVGRVRRRHGRFHQPRLGASLVSHAIDRPAAMPLSAPSRVMIA